ncbi:MAG TPA: glutamate--tRNA ligase family protein [Bacteroidia bacterium]|nr:glutamate--tRNA ligase family protein [Bacteroidia bacterium]
MGDFIVRRADGIHAYHLAVVIDNHFQEITEIVRGAGLLDATPRQIHLQQLLGYSTPAYCHLPVATNRQGLKISKQNHARRIVHAEGVKVLHKALQFLGQNPVDELLESNVEEIIRWGIKNWNLAGVPKRAEIPI